MILICGFHQLLVKQRLIYKRSNCIGIKEWCIDAGVIARASAAQATEGHHFLQMHALAQRIFQCTGPIPISESEKLAIFFKFLEKH